MSQHAAAGPEPARDMLLRTADEVERCRLLVRQIEAAIAPMIASRIVVGVAPQALDLLDQTLADLATCVSGLARGLPDDTVLAMLRLDDVRRRLTGQEAAARDSAVTLF